MNLQDLYDIYLANPTVQTDTRKLQPGEMFFALKGPCFNGNEFAKQALDAGAVCVVIDEQVGFSDRRLFKTDDVLSTLQHLAKHHRLQFNIPFIAITGSNGKTTTKELVHAVLSSKYITYTTKGNLNNHIGIPISILSVKSDAEMAVVEMGANHQKEIEGYCKYALPTHGIITNCGKAHLEGFGGAEGIRKGKGELYDFLRKNDGTAFLMKDYDYLIEMSKGIPHIKTYGTHNADIVGEARPDKELLVVTMKAGTNIDEIRTKLVGEYNLPNVLAAVTVGKHFSVGEGEIKKALENYVPSNSRSQLLEKDGNKIILDAYNANPTSMKAAIQNFAKMQGGNKILMLGSMMELGEDSVAEHAAIVKLIDEHQWRAVVLVGRDFNNVRHAYTHFDNSEQAAVWLQQQHLQNAFLLIKGSRSMQMEKVLVPPSL